MDARVTLFCGKTQQGKSTLALFMALKEWDRTIVLDSARARVFERIAPGGHFASWAELAKWLRTDGSRIQRWVVALRSKRPEDYAAALRCSEHMRGVLLFCDETHKLCRMEGVREPLELVALTGAHYGGGAGVGLYMVAQRPGSVPINIRSQAERVITFKQTEPRDIAWLAEWSGSQDWAAGVAGLADHRHTTWPANLTVRENPNEVAEMANDRRGNRSDERGARSGIPGDLREIQSGELRPEDRQVKSVEPGAVSAPGSGDAASISDVASNLTVRES